MLNWVGSMPKYTWRGASALLRRDLKRFTKTGDAFFNDRSHQTIIMPAEILFPVISDFVDPATNQKGNAMAKPNYQFKKRQKELAKKKKERGKKETQAGKQSG